MLTICRRFVTRLNQCRLMKFLLVSIKGIFKLHLSWSLDSAGIFLVDGSVSVVKAALRFGSSGVNSEV